MGILVFARGFLAFVVLGFAGRALISRGEPVLGEALAHVSTIAWCVGVVGVCLTVYVLLRTAIKPKRHDEQ